MSGNRTTSQPQVDGADPGALPAAVAAFLSQWPASIASVKQQNLLIEKIEDARGIRCIGKAPHPIWIVRRAARAPRITCTINVKSEGQTGETVIFLDRSLPKLKIVCAGGDSSLAIGIGGRLLGRVILGEGSKIVIGDGSTAEAFRATTHFSSIEIGKDCMLSSEVVLHCGRRHGLIDLNDPDRHIKPGGGSLSIGNHVWLAYGTKLVNNAKIGDGSIVGAGAVVASRFPGNAIIAGNPATIVRRDTTWSRNPDRIDDRTASYLESLGHDEDTSSPNRSTAKG